MSAKSARLSTNLIDRRVHLLTDEEAREEARRQGNIPECEIWGITAKSWLPALKDPKYQNINHGVIAAIHLDKDNELVYTIEFETGELIPLRTDFWRLTNPMG